MLRFLRQEDDLLRSGEAIRQGEGETDAESGRGAETEPDRHIPGNGQGGGKTRRKMRSGAQTGEEPADVIGSRRR